MNILRNEQGWQWTSHMSAPPPQNIFASHAVVGSVGKVSMLMLQGFAGVHVANAAHVPSRCNERTVLATWQPQAEVRGTVHYVSGRMDNVLITTGTHAQHVHEHSMWHQHRKVSLTFGCHGFRINLLASQLVVASLQLHHERKVDDVQLRFAQESYTQQLSSIIVCIPPTSLIIFMFDQTVKSCQLSMSLQTAVSNSPSHKRTIAHVALLQRSMLAGIACNSHAS
jgi:hypothetical protein